MTRLECSACVVFIDAPWSVSRKKNSFLWFQFQFEACLNILTFWRLAQREVRERYEAIKLSLLLSDYSQMNKTIPIWGFLAFIRNCVCAQTWFEMFEDRHAWIRSLYTTDCSSSVNAGAMSDNVKLNNPF